MSQSVHLVVHTRDLTALQSFYESLGFGAVSGDAHECELALDGFVLRIVQDGDAGESAARGSTPRLEIALRRADVAAEHDRMTAGGARSLSGPSEAGGHTIARIADPDGIVVRLVGSAAAAAAPTAPATAQPTVSPAQPASPPAQPASSGTPAPQASNDAPASQGAGSGTAAAQASADAPAPQASQASAEAPMPQAPSETVSPIPPAQASDDDLALPQSSLPAGYYTEDGTPTFDAVADRIRQRTATADGNEVLDSESSRGRDEGDQMARLKQAGRDRLDQLRKSMGFGS